MSSLVKWRSGVFVVVFWFKYKVSLLKCCVMSWMMLIFQKFNSEKSKSKVNEGNQIFYPKASRPTSIRTNSFPSSLSLFSWCSSTRCVLWWWFLLQRKGKRKQKKKNNFSYQISPKEIHILIATIRKNAKIKDRHVVVSLYSKRWIRKEAKDENYPEISVKSTREFSAFSSKYLVETENHPESLRNSTGNSPVFSFSSFCEPRRSVLRSSLVHNLSETSTI